MAAGAYLRGSAKIPRRADAIASRAWPAPSRPDAPAPRHRCPLPGVRPRVRALSGRLEPPQRDLLALWLARAPPGAVAVLPAPPGAARRRPVAAALRPRVEPAAAPAA